MWSLAQFTVRFFTPGCRSMFCYPPPPPPPPPSQRSIYSESFVNFWFYWNWPLGYAAFSAVIWLTSWESALVPGWGTREGVSCLRPAFTPLASRHRCDVNRCYLTVSWSFLMAILLNAFHATVFLCEPNTGALVHISRPSLFFSLDWSYLFSFQFWRHLNHVTWLPEM